MLSWRSGLSPVRIILIGVAINAVFTGLISALGSITGSKQSGVMAIVNANISMKTWDDVYNLLIYVLIGLTAAVLAAGKSNLLAMEDKTVRNLGVNVIALRLAVSCIAVLLVSISTAVAGTISFVGLIAPT